MTKKPTPASTMPATIDRRGTPALRSRRPGTRYLTTWAPPISSVATPSTPNAVAEPTASAHTAIAAHTSSAPGSTGSTTPAMPAAIATATTTFPRSLTAAIVAHVVAHRHDESPAIYPTGVCYGG